MVASATEANGVSINGMSLLARDHRNANSALLVGVTPADSIRPSAAGIAFQRQWERQAFAAGGGDYGAPVQLVGDFLERRPSVALGTVQPTYLPAGRLADLTGCLPGSSTDTLRAALPFFGQRLAGFDAADAVLTGVETRSSSPVRIVRDQWFEASLGGLYPPGKARGTRAESCHRPWTGSASPKRWPGSTRHRDRMSRLAKGPCECPGPTPSYPGLACPRPRFTAGRDASGPVPWRSG